MTLTDTPAPPRNVALGAVRVLAGVVGGLQLAGVGYFLLVAPEEAVWVGLAIDVPVLALLVGGILLKLATALAPRLTADRRIRLGLLAVGLSVVATLIKIPLYDEPESATLLAVDAVLLVLLMLAGRTDRTTSR